MKNINPGDFVMLRELLLELPSVGGLKPNTEYEVDFIQLFKDGERKIFLKGFNTAFSSELFDIVEVETHDTLISQYSQNQNAQWTQEVIDVLKTNKLLIYNNTQDANLTKLTYQEAFENLAQGKEVFFSGKKLFISSLSSILRWYESESSTVSHAAPYSITEKFFSMKKEPDYEVLGLHDDWVEIEVWGLKAYQALNQADYSILEGGSVYDEHHDITIGRVKFKGDHKKAKIRVTVSADKKITYEYL